MEDNDIDSMRSKALQKKDKRFHIPDDARFIWINLI